MNSTSFGINGTNCTSCDDKFMKRLNRHIKTSHINKTSINKLFPPLIMTSDDIYDDEWVPIHVNEINKHHHLNSKKIKNNSLHSTAHHRRFKRNIMPNLKSGLNEPSTDDIYLIACIHVEYMVFTWVLCLIALATTLKVYFLVKTALALVMVGSFAILIVVLYPEVFKQKQLERQ